MSENITQDNENTKHNTKIEKDPRRLFLDLTLEESEGDVVIDTPVCPKKEEEESETSNTNKIDL